MNKLLAYAAKFRTLTHLIALSILGSAGFIATHKDTLIHIINVIASAPRVSLGSFVTVLFFALYHNSQA